MTRNFDPDTEERRPKIWVDGGQRPPFDIRALGRASLHFARIGIAPVFAFLARWAKAQAVRVRDGAGRLPAEKLGRFARFVPRHQRVAMWIRNWAAIHAHASATADPDAPRGNALVAEVETHLWPEGAARETTAPAPGPGAAGAIQVLGFLHGWAGMILLLPYGLIRGLVAFARGQDLRKIGRPD